MKVETKPFAPPSGVSSAAVYDDLSNVPLWSNLGTVSYPVTTASPLAQRYFDQGLRLAYGFNHAEARRAFRKAQQIDPVAPCATGARRWSWVLISTRRWTPMPPPPPWPP